MGSLTPIHEKVVQCNQCPRLRTYCQEIAKRKRKAYRDWDYWGKPVPGFGDEQARLIIIGLAPGAHGANRTGRMFTGDSSGQWLYKALYQMGWASQAVSEHRNDNMQLYGVYITAALRCAPPKNKPTSQEIQNCLPFLKEELKQIPWKTALCLGHIAHNTLQKALQIRLPKFQHGQKVPLEGGRWVVCSYHPSRQNTQTGRLTWQQWIAVFEDVKRLLYL